ncbi:bifunctional PIG-L family deacetylase/class I SAM-dependent methyltransferase [Granulicella sibirica]|uniref:Methyltransferase type 12 n=1 Tax=Granulicella sibirica TaxID=2479048 RepID=A0A4Q0SSV5_9BACT|nr:bifunctional PIG-L family deacetylase/class I SAM-dependent methyltransferase [Granulicella sibirica]RXH53995.1 Methyltransferase type 12 [Granulicella sibirica]
MPTIVPITTEYDWLSLLAATPDWTPSLVPTIVLAPHPDDETLGAGGLIARLRAHGVSVTVLAITDGEGAYADTSGLDRVRVPEQTEALARLGVDESMIQRLGIPDRFVSEHEEELAAALRLVARAGMQIIAPWPYDFHPDHEAAGRAAAQVAAEADIPLFYYLFWTWHRGTPETLAGVHLTSVSLTESERATKRHALSAHASQLSHGDGQPILSARLLQPAERPFEIYIPVTSVPSFASSPAFFEAKYQRKVDPWSFSSKPSELFRYDHILGALAGRRYASAFEPGCSIGVLTERLASLCDHVHALDFSATAAERAGERCARLPNVTVECASIPDVLPSATTDLLVLSEIGYYLPLAEWTALAEAMIQPLRPGATVLAAHWLGYSEDHTLSGDEVHSALLALPSLRLDYSERHPTFRLDRMVRR